MASIPDAMEQVLEAWRTNNRIHLFLIREISDQGLRCTLSTRGGRNVVRQFCHLHNNRIYLLEGRARDLAEGLHKFETLEEPGRKRLAECLEASRERIETFFVEGAAGLPRRRVFKKGVIPHLAYLIAHESHHRGNILLTLKQCGHALPQAKRYAIWNWDKI